jgi:signal recognition particle receptor subunit alpha
MLESLLICNQGGLILYQYNANPSVLGSSLEESQAQARQWCNQYVMPEHWAPQRPKQFHIVEGVTLVWTIQDSLVACAFYPDILFEGPRQYLQDWARTLLSQTCQAYRAFHKDQERIQQEHPSKSAWKARPDPALFDATFLEILQSSKGSAQQSTTTPPTSGNSTHSNTRSKSTKANTSSKAGGKEKRTWHDGQAKVTPQAMAMLDKSKETTLDETAAQARAVAEAQAAYLPTVDDLKEDSVEPKLVDQPSLLSSWWTLGNKTLTEADLEKPLKQMETHLIEHNVAQSVADALCQGVKTRLVGQQLNTWSRVQTAVYQAMEKTLVKLLGPNNSVDLLRQVYNKRGGIDRTLSSLFNKSSPRKDPYVIVVVGINGVGKSTSLAKLAYHFKTNQCNPLLVAGDTFRSGAVEQLKVHAACLDVPLFAQGYAKDPSAVTQAAISHARANGHDVVLVDTAGRMQNNQPLMKALNKLVLENQPDFCLLVCEALVGHDGLDQFALFQQATGKIHGLLLTKFDTVSEKVGAALTMTYETGVPIVFCGTGQKYHHLQKLSVESIVQNLLK